MGDLYLGLERRPAPNLETLRPLLAELERFYGWARGALFGGGLRAPVVIHLGSRGRRQALGWFKVCAWKLAEHRGSVHEILVAAEDAARDPYEVLGTVLHEQVHQGNTESGVKDTDKTGRRHNKRFRDAAQAVGLEVGPKHKSLGFAFTTLTPSLKDRIAGEFRPDLGAFGLARVLEAGPTSKGRMLLWVCGCPVRIRAAVEVEARCLVCGEEFLRAGDG